MFYYWEMKNNVFELYIYIGRKKLMKKKNFPAREFEKQLKGESSAHIYAITSIHGIIVCKRAYIFNFITKRSVFKYESKKNESS